MQQGIMLPAEPPDPARQVEIYLETLADLCCHLPLGPLDPAGREDARLTLEQVYVGLDAQSSLMVNFGGQRGEIRSALAHVADQKRLIILGGPGSGKSTFLRFLALRLAQARLQPQGDWLSYLGWPVYASEKRIRPSGVTGQVIEVLGDEGWPHPPYVPLLVTLRDFAATDFDPTSPLALWQFVVADLTRRGLGETVAALQALLARGEGLWLLDGVDEVPLDRRALVWQAIGALARGIFNRCPWLATCRVLSYAEQEAAAAGATGRITLAPLNPPQIKTFITAWYQALMAIGEKTAVQSEGLADQLIRAATGPLRVLAENPMLLTIMALVQTYHGTLPRERAKLYQACVETLLLRWQRSKETSGQELPASLAELNLKTEGVERLLWEIGWVAQGAADIPEERVMALAKKHLGDYAKAQAFVEYTERRAHLLVGLGGVEDRRFGFPHRTFQEYLAGCYLANDRRFGRKAIPLAETGAAWREVLLLAAGTLVYNQKVERNLLDALEDLLPEAQPAPGDTPGWQRVWRCGEMLAIVDVAVAEADEVGQELLPRARRSLAALVAGGELTPPERVEAGQALAALGDLRRGVGLTALLAEIRSEQSLGSDKVDFVWPSPNPSHREGSHEKLHISREGSYEKPHVSIAGRGEQPLIVRAGRSEEPVLLSERRNEEPHPARARWGEKLLISRAGRSEEPLTFREKSREEAHIAKTRRGEACLALRESGWGEADCQQLEGIWPDIVWCEVEAGEFIMGDDAGDEDYGERPTHSVTLAAFQISQYPITHIQFNTFVAAGGYQAERYWPEARQAGHWLAGQFKGGWDNVARDKPYDFGFPFNLTNHPVVGVSWYEAVAFCRWLSDESGCLVRLPTEAEWEKAARGTDGRKYPWGDEMAAASRCNMSDTGINSTSAVGLFPAGASPYGVMDMSGNAWEWCSTIWNKKVYPFKVVDEWTKAYLNRTNVQRVLRGGGFDSRTDSVRCAARNRYSAYNWLNFVGFRVVLPLTCRLE